MNGKYGFVRMIKQINVMISTYGGLIWPYTYMAYKLCMVDIDYSDEEWVC